jgi:hypothetical protein
MSRIVHTSILGLVACALLVPAALAARPDDRGGLIGVGGTAAAAATSVRPDDRASLRGPGAFGQIATPSVRPDDRAGVRGPGAVPTVLLTQSPSGFDWSAAGIGALGAFGLALVLFGAMQVLGHARRSRTAV